MTTFTGYEPKAGAPIALAPGAGQEQENPNMQWYANHPHDPNAVREIGNMTAGSSSSNQSGIGRPIAQTHGVPAIQDAANVPVASASGQLVAADTDDLGRDLSNIMEQTLQSVEDFLEEDKEVEIEAMVPSQEGISSGIGQPLHTH